MIPYSGTSTDASPGAVKQLRVVGTFTKALATTGISITWNSHVTGVGGYCTFHVRVDGNQGATTDNCGANAGCVGATIFQAAAGTTQFPVSTVDVFPGLAAGTHTVTLWDRGVSSTSCVDNPGNFAHEVIVTEY